MSAHPIVKCGICGADLEFELESRRQGGPRRDDLVEVYGAMAWRQKPHRCPPEVVEAWARTINHPHYERKGSESPPPVEVCPECGVGRGGDHKRDSQQQNKSRTDRPNYSGKVSEVMLSPSDEMRRFVGTVGKIVDEKLKTPDGSCKSDSC